VPIEAPAKRRTQAARREEAETKLLNAATRLIATHGLDGFKLAEVGEAAGYSRGLPLHYFGTKENLLVRVAEYLVDAFGTSLARHPSAAPGLPRLEQMVRHYCSLPATTGVRALALLVSHARVVPALREAMQRLNAEGLKLLEAELRTGVALGHLRADVDCGRVARMIFSFLRGQLSFMVVDPSFDAAAVGEEFVRALASSAAAPAAKTAGRRLPAKRPAPGPRPGAPRRSPRSPRA